MNSSVTCKKVSALLSMYIDKKLDFEQTNFVRNHLEICPACYCKYKTLKSLLQELRNAYADILTDTVIHEKNRMFNIKEYEQFKTNLSAYFDNELSVEESVDIKKYMIKFPNARTDLEFMYNLHKILTKSFITTKKSFSQDFAKNISYQIQGKKYSNRAFSMKVAGFVGVILILGTLALSNTTQAKTFLEETYKKIFKEVIYVKLN